MEVLILAGATLVAFGVGAWWFMSRSPVKALPPADWSEGATWIVGPAERPLIQATPVQAAAVIPASIAIGAAIPDDLKRQVLSLLEAAPDALRSLAETGRGLEMQLSPELLQGVKDGTLKMMQAAEGGVRSAVVDASGKIVGHASFVPAAVSLAAVGAVAWQVAAIATRQKFLADIEKRLAGIESRGLSALEPVGSCSIADRWLWTAVPAWRVSGEASPVEHLPEAMDERALPFVSPWTRDRLLRGLPGPDQTTMSTVTG